MILSHCFKIALVALLGFSIHGFSANERPKMPMPGEDAVLMGGRPAAEYFAKKQSDGQCTGELRSARETYQGLASELKSLIASSASATAIDSKEAESRKARLALLKLLNQCGECAVRPMEQVKVSSGGKTEYWYLTDGSCYVGDLTAPKIRFEKARTAFLHTKNYARQNGGFYSILDCFGVHKTSQEKLPYEEMTSFPYSAFMAVKGPLGQSFNYLMDVTVQEATTPIQSTWTLYFTGSKAPLKFQNEVYEISASGQKKKTSPYSLSNVHGMWHLTSDGYFRYHTAADFRMPFGSMLNDYATDTLLDTLLHLVELSAEEM